MLLSGFSTLIAGFGGTDYLLDPVMTWKPLYLMTNTLLGVNRFDHSLLGTSNGSDLLLSNDTGHHWKNILGALPTGKVRATVAPPNRIYVATRGVYFSDDAGISWTETNDNTVKGDVTALSADSIGGLYAASEKKLYFTANGGDSWQEISIPIPVAISKIYSNRQSGVALLGNGDTMLRSTDRGLSWQALLTPDGSTATDVLLDGSNNLFVSTNTGVFYWAVGSTQMIDVSSGLDSLVVGALAIGPAGALYAATQGHGVMRGTGNLPNAVVKPVNRENRMTVYPNPAFRTLSIHSKSGMLNYVYALDEIGRTFELRSSWSGDFLHLDVSNLSPGAYRLAYSIDDVRYSSRISVIR